MKIKIVLGLLFPLIVVLAIMAFTNSSFAKDCTIASPTVNVSIDIMAQPVAEVPVGSITWTCYRDVNITSGNGANFCYRLEPTSNQQSRDDNSFYLTMAGNPTARLGFKIWSPQFGPILSKNDNSLPTVGFAWAPVAGLAGTSLSYGAGPYQLAFLPLGSQDQVAAGTYTGTFNFIIYQQDNYSGPPINNCANQASTSISNAGTINLTVTVQKNCLLEGLSDVDFGRMGGADAMKQPVSSTGSLSIRCTSKLPYFVKLDNGLNSVSGQRRMKSTDGKSFIPYKLCLDVGCNTPWATDPLPVGAGNMVNLPQKVPVYGKLTPLTVMPSAGTYQDTVVATVTF